MATKKITKGGTYNIQINSKSKDMVYELKNSSLASSVTLNFARATGYTLSNYYKLGNDLVLAVAYGEKLITNTIKNYFLYDTNYPSSLTNPNLVKADNSGIGNPNNIFKSYARGLFSDTNLQSATMVGSKGSDTYLISKVFEGGAQLDDFGGNDNYNIQAHYTGQFYLNLTDYFGNDNYSMSNDTHVFVKDKRGNDIYAARSTKKVTVNDDNGNDKYLINDTKTFTITDVKGKDVYEINASGDANSKITDDAGDDKYIFAKVDKITLDDKAGNDKYTLSSGKEITITDRATGKETYILTAEKSDVITDDAGNDKYAITASEYITITDKAGKDIYNVSYTKDLDLQDGLNGEIKSGNDKYNLSFVSKKDREYSQVTDFAGNDKYNVAYSDYLHIDDKKGSDNYVVKDSTDVVINDTGIAEKVGKKLNKKLADDKYTVSNSKLFINDKEGADIYKLTNSDAAIDDRAGNDKYTVSGYFDDVVSISDLVESADSYKITNANVFITDIGGNDTYNITTDSLVKINDAGGTKDKLILSDTNKDNLIYMANYKTSTTIQKNDVQDGTLFIIDKTTKSYIQINNYFETKYQSYNDYLDGYDNGYIESIKAGKKDLNSAINAYAESISGGPKQDALGEVVAEWLTTNNYDTDNYSSVASILNYTDKANEFIAYVSGYNQ